MSRAAVPDEEAGKLYEIMEAGQHVGYLLDLTEGMKTMLLKANLGDRKAA
jgi:hypothetical protein